VNNQSRNDVLELAPVTFSCICPLNPDCARDLWNVRRFSVLFLAISPSWNDSLLLVVVDVEEVSRHMPQLRDWFLLQAVPRNELSISYFLSGSCFTWFRHSLLQELVHELLFDSKNAGVLRMTSTSRCFW